MSTIEELQKKAAELPEPVAREVLDFLIFVSTRHHQAPSTPRQSLRGAFRGKLSDSGSFAKAKQREKALER